MPRIIAVASQKGGVGKTSLTQNLGAELALAGQRVLLVDYDPQSNLTTGWGLDLETQRPTILDAMLDAQVSQRAIVPVRERLELLPASLDLAAAELQFAAELIGRVHKLKKALAPIVNRYDFILIDSPPSLGFLTVNALAAATETLVPLQCQGYAYQALDQLFAIMERVREVNPTLKLGGIVLTMHDPRNALTSSVEDAARERFGGVVHQTVVPINVRIAEAPLSAQAVGEFAPHSKGAAAYKSLAEEVLARG